MTQGIRAFVNTTFNNLLKQRSKLGNTEFRRAVMQAAIEEFDITLASAATAYNYALQKAREEMPEKVEGLGREPGHGGGRKPIYTVDVVKTRTGEVVAAGLSRAAAQKMLDESNGQGRPKLSIKEPEAQEAAAPAEEPVEHNRRSTDVQPAARRPGRPRKIEAQQAPAPRQQRERRATA